MSSDNGRDILGKNIKELRLSKGLSRSKAAKALGIPESTLLEWENGQAEPGVDGLISLAKLFRVAVDQLLFENRTAELTEAGKDVLGKNIRQLRESKGLNQGEVAKALGVPGPTFSGWERGEREPSVEWLKRLARFFDVTLDRLLLDDRALRIGSHIPLPKDAWFHPIQYQMGYFDLLYPLIFNRLFWYDPHEMRFIPEIAQSWCENRRDGSYTFFLLKGIQFHDGRLLELGDVKYSYDEYLKRKDFFSKYIDSVEASEEDYAIIFKFHEGKWLELHELPMPYVVRSYEGEGKNECFLGTGPFKLARDHQDRLREGLKDPVRLNVNNKYFAQLPLIQSMEFHKFKNADSLRDGLKNGAIHLAIDLALENSNGFKIEHGFGDIAFFLVFKKGFEKGKSITHDENFRKAVNSALDRRRITNRMESSQNIAGVQFLPSNHLYNILREPPDEENPYDPDRAREFLESAEETDMPLMIAPLNKGNELELELIKEIKQQLEELGIKAERQKGDNKDRAHALVGVIRFDTPQLVYSNLHSTQSKGSHLEKPKVPWRYSNPDVDALLDNIKGMDTYRNIQSILSEECVFIPLFRRGRVVTHVDSLEVNNRLRVTSLLYGPDVVHWRFK